MNLSLLMAKRLSMELNLMQSAFVLVYMNVKVLDPMDGEIGDN